MINSPIHLSNNLEHAVAWSIFAELVRRHPGELNLWMDYYPTGAQMLSAARTDGAIHVSLNYNGGGLWVRDSHRHFRHDEPVWNIALGVNARAVSPASMMGPPVRQCDGTGSGVSVSAWG